MAEAEPAPPAEEPVDQRMEAVREPPAAQPTEPLLPPAPHPAKALLPPAGQPAKPLLPPPAPHPPKQEDQGEPAPKKRGPRPKKAAEAAGGPAKGPPSASLVDGVPPPNRRGRPPKKPPGGTLPAASGFSSPNPAPLPSLAATAPAPNRIEPHTPDVQQSPANAEPPNSPRVGVKAEDGPSAAYTPVPTLRAASEGPPLVFVSVHLSPSVKLSSAPLREAESPAPRRYFLPPNTTVAEVREKVARKLMERDPNAEFYLELESPVGRGEVMEGQTLHAAVLAAPEVKLWLCQRTPEEVWV
ncbi:hypothetical protein DFJ74DRAFT_669688 [Hyaloraphidium curvatum]|nr:hypothetical protein DFJ74DRAFT_669688 [Hyaloraphidium curvatum]